MHARNEAGTTNIPIPVATGTHFSWDVWLYLWCSADGGSTHISNKTVQLATAEATGLHNWFKAIAIASYVQPTTNLAADSGSNGATPAGYTEDLSASATQYDGASTAATNSAMAGAYSVVGLGVDFLYTLGGGTGAVPSITSAYDEGPIFLPLAALMTHDVRLQVAIVALGLTIYAVQKVRRFRRMRLGF